MSSENMDALLITTENNLRYFTGFTHQAFVILTRPWFAIIPAAGEPIAVIPESGVGAMALTGHVGSVNSWPSPRPDDEGVSLLAATIRDSGFRTIGAELGPESRVGMPLADFLHLLELIKPATVKDASGIIHRARMIKSDAEIIQIRTVAAMATAAYARVSRDVQVGMTERDVFRVIARAAIELGVDSIRYLPVAAGRGGYSNVMNGPTDNVLTAGDVVYADTGVVLNGYYCDVNRNWGVGYIDAHVQDAHQCLYEAVEIGIGAVRPGHRISDIWQLMAAHLGKFGEVFRNSRMGHGLGLDYTEPPSITPDDHTMLEPGMVLAIEPGLMLGDGQMLIHEENVAVTSTGSDLLTERGPAYMPVIV
jgi:Xaa-Pro aminopeptidase